MKIILVRHGETTWNKENRIQGCTDIPLAPEGHRQLSRTGKQLAQSGIAVDHILSSPLIRAYKSAEIIAAELHYPTENILPAPLFVERHFGVAEGMIYNDVLAMYPDNNIPGMETLEELLDRASKAIKQCADAYPNSTLLITAHGAIIKAILVVLTHGRLDYFDNNVWIENGSYCVLEGSIDSPSITIYRPGNDYIPQHIQ